MKNYSQYQFIWISKVAITRFRILFIRYKSYTNVTLISYGKGLIVNEKNGTRKYNIYIPYIKRIKINEGVSNPIGKP